MLLARAVDLLLSTRPGSGRVLLRDLRTGGGRGELVLTVLEDVGIVGPARTARPREVLCGPDDTAAALLAALGQGAAEGVACEAARHVSDQDARWTVRTRCPRCHHEEVCALCDPWMGCCSHARTCAAPAVRPALRPPSWWRSRALGEFRDGMTATDLLAGCT